jgi:hypothetical protein
MSEYKILPFCKKSILGAAISWNSMAIGCIEAINGVGW